MALRRSLYRAARPNLTSSTSADSDSAPFFEMMEPERTEPLQRLRSEGPNPEKRCGTGNQRQAVHGAGGVPQGVEDPVGRNQRLGLTHDAAAHRSQDLQDLHTRTRLDR